MTCAFDLIFQPVWITYHSGLLVRSDGCCTLLYEGGLECNSKCRL